MKTAVKLSVIACFVLLICATVHAQIPAFPGAEGFGAYANGGRGGDVYTVTTLNNNGAGSLRVGLDTAPPEGRTIVFAVSGYIPVSSDTNFQIPSNVTIAGQTAPGDGVGLQGGLMTIKGNDVIMRHFRIRHGKYGTGGDCLNINGGLKNIMLDHVDMMFSTDENFSFFQDKIDDFTMQYCSTSWGMERHNAGGLWDMVDGTCHHSLWAHHRTRNPKARPTGTLEWINNVTFDARSEGFIMGDTQSTVNYHANVEGSYFVALDDYEFGIKSKALVKARISDAGLPTFHLYLNDCLHDSNVDGIVNGTDKGYGIVDGVPYPSGGTTPGTVSYDQSATPFTGAPVAVTVEDPLTAYKKVISSVGPLRLDAAYAGPLRDELNDLLIESVENQESIIVAKDTPRTPTVDNPEYAYDPPSNGEYLLAQLYGISNNGFGTLNSAAYPADGDGDGMPDFWELTLGSNAGLDDHNTAFANNGSIITAATFFPPSSAAGYTYLEEYLYFKALPHAVMEKSTVSSPSSLTVDLSRYTRGFTNSPSFSVTVFPGFGTYQQFESDGTTSSSTGPVIVFTPNQNFSGRAKVSFTVSDADGSSWAQNMLILVDSVEPPKDLVWQGDGSANVWDGSVSNFLDGTTPATFSVGDHVMFDDTGSRSPAVQVTGNVAPGAVQVDTDLGYTFGGSGVLSGAMALEKTGTGSLTIANTGPNTYSGGTVVSGGTLTANNTSGTGSGSVTVNSAGTLGGYGTISGAVSVNSGAAIAPGTGIGTLNVNSDVTLNSGSATVIEINKTAGTKDLLDVSGTLTLGGTLTVTNLSGTLAFGDSFKILDAGSYSGSFSSISLPALGGTLQWDLGNLKTSGTIAVVDPGRAPAPPSGLTATAGDTQVALTWTASPFAESYIVKRATLSGGPYTGIVTNAATSYVNSGLPNGTTFYYVVSAVNAYGEGVNSSQVIATPAKIISYQVNSGGSAAGPFVADTYFSSGSVYTGSDAIDTSGVVNPAPAAVYQSERYGNFSYVVPGLVPGANYLVRLHFAEIYHNASGLREFNVFVNGTQVLTNFDIYAEAGAKNKAVVREFNVLADGSGQLVIQYVGVVDKAKSSGIEVLSAPLPQAQVNSGGAAANPFVADDYYSSGSVYTTVNAIDTSGEAHAAPAAVYQSERHGNFSYVVPGLLPGANYLVRLHFAEIYHSASGLREFNVLINGTQVLTDFDIYAAAGAKNKAVVREFNALADGSGRLLIQYVTVIDSAKSSGIEVLRDNTSPAFTTSVPNQTINVGAYLSITNTAVDADALTFSLQDGPAGSTLVPLNASNCVFSWRPNVTHADNTYQVNIVTTDNGTPNLSATQSFSIFVNPLTEPVVSVPMISSGQIGFSVDGEVGPDYAIQGSTNLLDWTTLQITNPPVMPFTWSTNTGSAPIQFYRIMVGPPFP